MANRKGMSVADGSTRQRILDASRELFNEKGSRLASRMRWRVDPSETDFCWAIRLPRKQERSLDGFRVAPLELGSQP